MRVSAYTILLFIFAFTLLFLNPRLLILDTTATGGDTASHVYTASYLATHLLPKGRLTGWCMGNLGGFPMLQNYFPLPFLIMAGMSLIIPFNIAFKLITVVPILVLPWAVYRFFRYLSQPVQTASAASVLVLPFLFMEGQSIWGGNILSVLSGTFCYSFGLCFALLFLGLLFEHFNGKPRRITCSCLLALTGLSHGYALLFAGFGSLFFLTSPGRFRRNFIELCIIHGCGIGLMSFWLIPLIAYLPYTTKFGFAWDFADAKNALDQIFPAMVRPFVIVSALTPLILNVTKNKQPDSPGLYKYRAGLFLFHLCFTGLFLYAAGCRLKVVDIRFLPFFQFFSIVSGALIFSLFTPEKPIVRFLIPLLLFSTCLWVQHSETKIRLWSAHNNKGFENTPLWPDYTHLMNTLKGSVNDPRVVYENSPVTEHTGTIRAFESLPFFSGRSTLEGVYIQGSLLSPFIFHIQAELSEHPSAPLSDYPTPARNLDSALRHLRLFNVSHLILIDEKTKENASLHPALNPVTQAGPFQVFEIKDRLNQYVEPVENKPHMITSPEFRRHFYTWFDSRDLSVPLVHIKKPDPLDLKRFNKAEPDIVPKLPREPIDHTGNHVAAMIKDDEIIIDHAVPGKPLIVKVSYHPGWKAEGADRIYLTAPAFMLIYPTQTHVRMKFGNAFPDYLGFILTILTVAFISIWYIVFRNHPGNLLSGRALTIHPGPSTHEE